MVEKIVAGAIIKMTPIDPVEFGATVGTIQAQIEALNERFSEHIKLDAEQHAALFDALRAINDTLSQAKGAQKVFVWIIGTLFAGVALAKGWLWKP